MRRRRHRHQAVRKRRNLDMMQARDSRAEPHLRAINMISGCAFVAAGVMRLRTPTAQVRHV